MCHEASTAMACEPVSVSAARHWAISVLREVYAEPGEAVDVVELVVSELVSNCVRAAAHSFELALELHHGRVRVAARDDAIGMPTPRHADPHDVAGRGLAIIEHLTNAWGVHPEPAGKTVWADVPVHPTAGPVFDCHEGTGTPGAPADGSSTPPDGWRGPQR